MLMGFADILFVEGNMDKKQKSFSDRIRGMAEDIDCSQTMVEYDFIANRLRELADELEEKLEQEPPKKA
jgi:uncharacterized coiled-coil DUF342 family protein